MLHRSCHAAAGVVLGALIAPAAAHAEVETARPTAVTLVYEVPNACPSAAAFRQQVEARGSEHAQFLESLSTAKALRVRIRVTMESDGRARAQLTIVSQRGDTSERAFDAATCDEVVEASALLVAIAIEAEPRVGPPPPAPSPPPRSRAPLTLVVYAGAGVVTGLGPSLGPAFEGGAGVRSNHGWAPEARLEVRRASVGTSEIEGGAARFDLLAGAAEGCPIAYRGLGLRIAPCAAISVGRLSAKASGYANARERAVLYVGAEVGGRLTIDVGSVFVGMDVWGVLPLTRETFIFGTAGTAHRAASFGVSSSATVGLHFK